MNYDSTSDCTSTIQQTCDRFQTTNFDNPRLSTFFISPPASYELAPPLQSSLKSPCDSGYASRRPSQESEKPARTTWQQVEEFFLEMPRRIDDSKPLQIQRYTHSSRCSANRVPSKMIPQIEKSKPRRQKRYTHSSRCKVNPSFNPATYGFSGNANPSAMIGCVITDISYLPCEVLAHADPIENESGSQDSDLPQQQFKQDQQQSPPSPIKVKKGIEDISVDDFRKKSKRTLKQVSKTLPLRVT